MNNKVLSALMLSVILMFVISCSPATESTTDENPDTDPTGTIEQSESTTQADITIPEEAGSDSVEEFGLPIDDPFTPPDGWRDDIPLMEGFSIQTFDDFSGTADGDMLAVCTGQVPINEAYDFYSNLEGWEPDSGGSRDWITEGDRRNITYTRDDWKLTITLTAIRNETSMSILVVW